MRIFFDSVLKQQNQQPGHIPQPPQTLLQMQNNWNNMQSTGNGSGSLPNAAAANTNIANQIEAINAQQLTLQEQIRQSEQNLSAQHNVSRFSAKYVVLRCNYNIPSLLNDYV